MSKANGKSKQATEMLETMTGAPAEAMRKGLEQFMSFGGDFTETGRASLQALSESARAAGKGIEAMNSQTLSYMKTSMEQGMEATRAMSGVKSVTDLTEMQTSFARTAFQAYVDQMNEMAKLFSATLRETVEPLNTQAGAMAEKLQGAN